MRTAYTLLALTLLTLPSAPALGQNVLPELHGEVFSVENGEQAPQFFPNVQITLREFGASGLTNDQGLFRIQLPGNVLSGQEVTLRHDKKGYAICFPLLGKQLIPADLTRLVEVRMLPEGSKLFWTHERIEEFIARTASESAKKPPSRPGEATDLSAYILELGRHNGFTADEVRQQIGKWMEVARKDVTDFRRQGMVAFAERNFRLAGENFRRSAEEMEQQAAKNLRASAADRELSGDSFFNAWDYRQALQQYRLALTLLTTYKDNLGPLGIKTYPEHTVDVQRITFKSANAKGGLGERVAGPDNRRYLEEAVREYQGLIGQVPRSSHPQRWAATQHNLGSALRALSERQGGPEGQRRLAEAVEAHRQALTVHTRDDLPQRWARTQKNLGTTPRALGERQGGPEGLRRLSEAVEAYRLALTVYTRDHLPQDWATTQNHLGLALQTQVRLGGFPAGLEQVDRLAQAEGIRDDPVAQASLQALAIVYHVATRQDTEAGRAFASLVALVERQPADFHLVWDWTDLRDHLSNSKAPPIPARREPLLKLLDAVSRDNNKAAILAGLKEVQATFPARAEEPALPIRQPRPQGRGVPAGPAQRP